MSTENVCEHCTKEFSTKRNLSRHQLTAKYCAKIRNLDIDQKFQCPHCEYGTCLKADFNKHVTKCVIKNEEKSEEKEVERLKKELLKRDTELLIRNAKIEVLEKIVERPNVVNNTNNTNNTNITLNMLIDHSMKILSPYEELLEKLPKLITKYVTYEKYKKGIYGITSALIEGILQHEGEKWIVCYDGNKQDFHEKRLGRIEIDQRASYFFDHFTEALKPKVEEFSKRDLHVAGSDEIENSSAYERKKRITKLYDPISSERKSCIKNVADAIYLSKNCVRMCNIEQNDDDSKMNTIITDKMRTNFFLKHLSEYLNVKPLIRRRMEYEFTFDRCMRGIPGLVEASKNVLTINEKISVIFFNSEFQIRVGNIIEPIPFRDLIKEIIISIGRLREDHEEECLKQFPNDIGKLDSLQKMFKEIWNMQFYEKKDLSGGQFINLLAETLTISDDEIRNDM